MATFSSTLVASVPGMSGVVVGALLNDGRQIEALGSSVDQAPHKGRPKAPVLEVKPRHTLASDGSRVLVPEGFDALEAGASLGIVIGRSACRVSVAQALEFVAGYLIAGDFSLPLASHYRPSVRLKARDGYCPLGPRIVPAGEIADPDALSVRVHADNALIHECSTAGRVRGVAQLLCDVTEFMTLNKGDVLLLGRSHGAPHVSAGQTVRISIEGLGEISVRIALDEQQEGRK